MSKQQFFGRSTPHHLQISSKLALRLFSDLKKSWKFRLNIFTTSKVKSIWNFTCFCQLSLFANWQFGWNFETNNWITWEPLNIFAEIFTVCFWHVNNCMFWEFVSGLTTLTFYAKPEHRKMKFLILEKTFMNIIF